MKKSRFKCRRSLLAAAIIMTVMMAMSVIAYAAGDEILGKVRVLFGQNETETVMIQSGDGKYHLKIDENNSDSQSYIIEKTDGSPADEIADDPANFDIKKQ